MNSLRRMPEQDRVYRPNSQSTRKTEVESTLANIVTHEFELGRAIERDQGMKSQTALAVVAG